MSKLIGALQVTIILYVFKIPVQKIKLLTSIENDYSVYFTNKATVFS